MHPAHFLLLFCFPTSINMIAAVMLALIHNASFETGTPSQRAARTVMNAVQFAVVIPAENSLKAFISALRNCKMTRRHLYKVQVLSCFQLFGISEQLITLPPYTH